MKELDFKEVVINDCKQYLSENLTDDEIFDSVILYSINALDGVLGLCFDFSAMQDILAFYLLNSKECDAIKKRYADSANKFVDAAQIILRHEIQLGVLSKALFEMTEEHKTV